MLSYNSSSSLLFNEFPIFLVDPRWNKANEHQIDNGNILLSQFFVNQVLDDDDDSVDLPLPSSFEKKNESNQMSSLSQGERFLKLFHESKNIRSRASERIVQSEKVAHKYIFYCKREFYKFSCISPKCLDIIIFY